MVHTRGDMTVFFNPFQGKYITIHSCVTGNERALNPIFKDYVGEMLDSLLFYFHEKNR